MLIWHLKISRRHFSSAKTWQPKTPCLTRVSTLVDVRGWDNPTLVDLLAYNFRKQEDDLRLGL
jgi:hypothetical protein